MGRKATPEEKAAYGTACAIAARLVEQYPDLGADLRELLDAAKTEQRLACERGRPIFSQAERLVSEAELFLYLNRPAGTPSTLMDGCALPLVRMRRGLCPCCGKKPEEHA